MSVPNLRGRYLDALGIHSVSDKSGNKDAEKLKAALGRAHDIRQFEIELYWKRATYFWAFQLVAFTALGLLFKDGELRHPELLVIPAVIGAVTAFAGYLPARGSKFWQENWEAHVELLEDETEGRLTQVIVCRKDPQFSVSRTNQFLLLFLTMGWGLVLIVSAIPQAPEIIKGVPPLHRSIGIISMVALACALMYCRSRTDLVGRVFRADSADWIEYPSARKRPVPFLIWRDPIGGRK
jgi:hypothetical protein